MITALIVYGTIAMAAVYCVAYVRSPTLRMRIEAPKYHVLKQLRAYDETQTVAKSEDHHHES